MVDPLRPYGFSMVWDGALQPVSVGTNPPLQSYWLALLSLLLGESEAVYQLGVLPFGLLGLWATGLLARRFGASPNAARLLVATAPVVVVLSQRVMPDVTLFGLVTAGMALGLRAIDEGRLRDSLLAGFALGLATLARYTAMGAVLLLLAYPWLARRSFRHALPAIGLALAILVGWNALTFWADGRPHIANLWQFQGLRGDTGEHAARDIALHAEAMMLYLGGAVLAPPLLAVSFALSLPSKRRLIFWSAGVALVGAFAVAYFKGWITFVPEILLYPLLFSSSALFLAVWVWRASRTLWHWRSRRAEEADELLLLAWLLGFALSPLPYIHVAAKYLVPAVPPLVLLFLRMAPPRSEPIPGGAGVQRSRKLLVVAASLGLVLSLLCALAERRLAEVAPEVARAIAEPLMRAGHRVWFRPEWGFPLYLEPMGARQFHRDAGVQNGDLVLTSRWIPQGGVPRWLQGRVREISRTPMPTGLPLLTMFPERHAGFHSHTAGWLPYAILAPSAMLEEIRVYQVTGASPLGHPRAPKGATDVARGGSRR